MSLVSVAVPVPFLDLLTYRVPAGTELPPIGARVRVPLGSRVVTGCVVEHVDESASCTGSIKDLHVVVDREPFLPSSVVELCRWVADYYVAGIGDAIAVAMPPMSRDQASGFRTRRVAAITAQGLSALGGPAAGGSEDPPLRTDLGPDDPADPYADAYVAAGLQTRLADQTRRSSQTHLTAKQCAALEVLAPAAAAGLSVSDLRD